MAKFNYNITSGEGQKRLMAESMGQTYVHHTISLSAPGDYGADPVGDGSFRMVPSGDIVDLFERNRRLTRKN